MKTIALIYIGTKANKLNQAGKHISLTITRILNLIIMK